MFGVVITVSLIFLAGTSYGERGERGERCTCNRVHHTQDHFCTSDYALHVRIYAAAPSPLPGGRNLGDVYNPYMKYEVEVIENFKQDDYQKGQIIDVYSPRRGICGRTGLFDDITEDAINEYLLVGDISRTKGDDKFMVITNCNWVEKWEDLPESQKEGLRGMYSDCSCLIIPVSGPMETGPMGNGDTEADKFSYEDCFFNPVKAEVLRVTDCETLHGFCRRQWDNTCRWEHTDAFRTCFETRKNRLTISAAAVRTKEQCKLFTGRQKKKCLLKFLKDRNSERK